MDAELSPLVPLPPAQATLCTSPLSPSWTGPPSPSRCPRPASRRCTRPWAPWRRSRGGWRRCGACWPARRSTWCTAASPEECWGMTVRAGGTELEGRTELQGGWEGRGTALVCFGYNSIAGVHAGELRCMRDKGGGMHDLSDAPSPSLFSPLLLPTVCASQASMMRLRRPWKCCGQ